MRVRHRSQRCLTTFPVLLVQAPTFVSTLDPPRGDGALPPDGRDRFPETSYPRSPAPDYLSVPRCAERETAQNKSVWAEAESRENGVPKMTLLCSSEGIFAP